MMEKNIENRLVKERIERDKRDHRHDIKRKTFTCRNRELWNHRYKKQIDFESVVGKTARL